MSAALCPASPWYAGALRRFGSLLHAAADRLESPAPRAESLEPAPDSWRHDERVFEIRNRILNGYY